MTKTYTMYSDPGHGWLKVTKADLAKLGITDKVSSYSYMRGNYAYLEEDCDASLFLNTLEATGVVIKVKESFSNKSSRIRSYADYRVLTDAEEYALADLKVRMLKCKNWDKKHKSRILNADLGALNYWQSHYGF